MGLCVQWEVCRNCLQILVKLLSQYEPKTEDFVNSKVLLQGGGSTSVNPPPGFHLMAQLCAKSELFRLVSTQQKQIYIINEQTSVSVSLSIRELSQYFDMVASYRAMLPIGIRVARVRIRQAR